MLENAAKICCPEAIKFPSPVDSQKIVDDLRVSLSLHYVLAQCLGHPDCSVSLGQWDAEVRQGGEMFFNV